jgi:adenylate kinase family enzyme
MRVKFPPTSSLDRLVSSKRILVLGSSGSGKTYLSTRLAQQLAIEPIHLDKYFWHPGWIPTPQTEWRKRVSQLVSQPAWIIDGMYESTLDLRLPPSETIIIVESGPISCTWGVVKRKLTVDDEHRTDAPPGQKIDRAFLRYIWRYPWVTRPHLYQRLDEYASGKNLVFLKGKRGGNELIQLLDARADRNLPRSDL